MRSKENALHRYDEQLRFLTADNNVLADTPYRITLADGSTVEGRTDAGGKTQRIVTEQETAIICAEFYPETFYGCACQAEQACVGGQAPAPALRVELDGIKTNGTAIGHSVAQKALPNATKSRGMTAGEIAMARTVFKGSIDYGKVKIHRGGLLGKPTSSGNAMTPRGEIHFPDTPSGYKDDFSMESKSDQVWFIHEMAHVWQYQLGYNVIWAGIRLGAKGGYSDDDQANVSPAYRYYPDGQDKEKTLTELNMEQQAQLISHYFGAMQLNIYDYTKRLPWLSRVLAKFLQNPSDSSLLPQTTEVESRP